MAGCGRLKTGIEKDLRCFGKMIGLVIGASEDSIYALQVAKKMGIKTVAMDGDSSARGLDIADEKCIVDISDVKKVEKVVKEIQPDFLIPVPIGRMLYMYGKINEMFQLPGIKEEAGFYSTDKYKFHQKLKEEQLRNCNCVLVASDRKDAVKYEGKYPAILKPRYGSGSRDVFTVRSEAELKKTLQNIKYCKEDFVLEELEAGNEYGVDGAVVNGQFQLILLRKKIITPFPVRQAVGSLSISDDIDVLNQVKRFFQKIVTCMKLDQCLMNADIIINENGIFPIEVSARPSGHNLHSIFVPLATGIDMIEEYLKYLKREKEYNFLPKYTKKMLIRYFDFENCKITSIPTQEELVGSGYHIVQWECNIKVGDIMEKVIDGHSIMGRGYFVIEGNSEEELCQLADEVLVSFGVEKLDRLGN